MPTLSKLVHIPCGHIFNVPRELADRVRVDPNGGVIPLNDDGSPGTPVNPPVRCPGCGADAPHADYTSVACEGVLFYSNNRELEIAFNSSNADAIKAYQQQKNHEAAVSAAEFLGQIIAAEGG